ncbi:MAG: OmpA family protein [Methylobacter sp.]|nr:OmpA family protein [Methylobacter sp.]
MHMCIRVIMITLLLVSVRSFADYYQAPMQEVNWQFKGSNTVCYLKQVILFYGSADFIHRTGEPLQFSIQEQRRKSPVTKATLTAMPAPWMHEAAFSSSDYQVYLDQPVENGSYGRLSVYGDAAEAMLDILLQGQYPTFTYIRDSSVISLEETRVAVSSINFSDSYKEFINCRNNLRPVAIQNNIFRTKAQGQQGQNIQNIQSRTLFFDQGSNRMSELAKQEVNKIADYMKQTEGTEAIVSSDTALAGSTDKKLFVQRAAGVVSQLKQLGIAANRLSARQTLTDIKNNVIKIDVFGPDDLRFFYFTDSNNADLDSGDKQRLDLLARYVRDYFNQGRLVISSHTDSKGSRIDNQAVARKRGENFKRYLERKGVPAARIQLKAYGEDRPTRSNRRPQGRAQNRRLVIDFVG